MANKILFFSIIILSIAIFLSCNEFNTANKNSLTKRELDSIHFDSMYKKLFYDKIESPKQNSIMLYGSTLNLPEPWTIKYKDYRPKTRRDRGYVFLNQDTIMSFYENLNMDRNYEEEAKVNFADTLDKVLLMLVEKTDPFFRKEMLAKRIEKDRYYYYFNAIISREYVDSKYVETFYNLVKAHIVEAQLSK